MVSRMPPVSPAATMLTYRSLNAFGCFLSAFASDEPDSTSSRTCRMMRWNVLFSSCSPRICRHWTSGRPASIMTENWRVNTARLLSETPPRILGRAISLPFSLTVLGTICCRRRTASTVSLFSATRMPLCGLPARSRPFHSKLGMA
jgi:hypothetical protein